MIGKELGADRVFLQRQSSEYFECSSSVLRMGASGTLKLTQRDTPNLVISRRVFVGDNMGGLGRYHGIKH